MAARVSQSAFTLFAASNPNARLHQSVVTLFLLPAPVATPGVTVPEGGGGGVRPSSCGCPPEILLAERMRRLRWKHRAWPYVHVFGPGDSEPVRQGSSIAAPGLGVTAVVLTYPVPSGMRFVLEGVINDYSGGAFLPGDASWTLDVNAPLGVLTSQANFVEGLAQITVPLGSIASGAVWPAPRAFEFAPLDVIRAKVTNVNLGGGIFSSMLVGYLLPDVPEYRP